MTIFWYPKTSEALGSFGAFLGPLLAVLELSWGSRGASWGRLGASWGRLGRSWGGLGASWEGPGPS